MRQFILIITLCLLTVVSANAEDSSKFLDTNKVWEYVYYLPIDYHSKAGSLYRYEIDGTEEYNGKKYQILWQTQEIRWSLMSDNSPNYIYDVDTITEKKKIAILREENNKVYMPYLNEAPIVYTNKIYEGTIPNYNGIDNSLLHIIPESRVNCTTDEITFTDNDEIVLFDFSSDIEIGNNINMWCVVNQFGDYGDDSSKILNYAPCVGQYKVKDIREQSIFVDNREIISRTFETDFGDSINNVYKYNSYVGAIGNDSFILGPFLRFFILMGTLPDVLLFNNLYDKEGNVIFAGENFKVPSNQASASQIEKDGKAAGRKYDVMGREIKHPEPGSIYIQDGRKYIAR